MQPNTQKITHTRLTETVKRGLERIAQDQVYNDLLKFKGTYKFPLNLNELRKDR